MKTFLYLLLMLPLTAHAQDYIQYQRIFNRIDDDIIANNVQQAIPRLDSVYKNYSFIFARHCVKALQICGKINDSLNADKWLTKAFIQGVPLTVLDANALTKKSLQYPTTSKTIKAYDSLRSLYLNSFNHSIAHTIDSLLKVDQRKTKKINFGFILLRYTVYWPAWLHNNKTQYRFISKIVDDYGYPGERLIGLPEDYNDTAWTNKSFSRFVPNIFDRRVQTMLMHCYSNPRKDINTTLFQNVTSGYLTPKQYAIIQDFLAEYGRSKYGTYTRTGEWFPIPKHNNLVETDTLRHKLGLNTLAQKHRNDSIFNQRVKDRTADQEIILE